MTPQLAPAPFTLPATLYRYQPAPGYREGAGLSTRTPLKGVRLGVGVSRHRPGPLTDTPKDHGTLTYTPNAGTAGAGLLIFQGSRTTRTWDLYHLLSTFTHPITTPAGPQGPTNNHDSILYLQTTQRQTVEGLTAALATDPQRDPTNPDALYTLSNLLFNTPNDPANTLAAQHKTARRRTARRATGTALLALALLAGSAYAATSLSKPPCPEYNPAYGTYCAPTTTP